MFHFKTDDEAPFGVALSSVAGMPEDAIDAAWRSGLITSATNRLQPPTEHLAQEMIDSPTTVIEHHALAGSLRDTTMLHDLIVKHPDAAVNAADNCFLSRETAELAVSQTDDLSNGPIGERLLIPESYGTLTSDQQATAATDIVLARFATHAAQLFDKVADGTASESEAGITESIIDYVITGEDPNAGDHRRFRAALLELVGDDARQSLLFKISEAPKVLGTPSDWKNLIELIDEGLLFEEEIETRVDADAWLWAKLTGNGGYDAFAAFGKSTSTGAGKPKEDLKGRKAVQIDSTSDEAELMALLGYEEVAARTVLDSNATVTQEELEASLDAADAETVIDWAEGRLPRRPFQGDVTQQMMRMGTERMLELSSEVGRRPDPLKQNEELIVMTPGIASMQIDPKSSRALAEFLVPRIQTSGWAVLLSLLSDNRDNDTVIQLLDAANAISAAS